MRLDGQLRLERQWWLSRQLRLDHRLRRDRRCAVFDGRDNGGARIRALDADASLEPLHAGKRTALRLVASRDEHARDHEFEVQSRRGRAGHLGEGGVGDIRCPAEFRGAEPCGLHGHAGEFVRLDAAENRRRAIRCATLRIGADNDEVAQAFEQILDEAPGILAGLDHPVDGGEGGGRIPSADRIDDFAE